MSDGKLKAQQVRESHATKLLQATSHEVDTVLGKSWEDNKTDLEQYINGERFKYAKRPYNAGQVAPLRGTLRIKYPASDMADKLYRMLRECKAKGTFLHTWGAIDPVQVINLSKYMKTVYVSGWQCSSMASTSHEPGPDFADYPADTVPTKVKQLFKAQLYHDSRQSEERSRMNADQLKSNPAYDYFAPMIADADTGFGGPTAVMKLTKMFIEAGAAGIHLEDQRVGAKKCGHMSGKVLVSTREFVNKLISVRLQADIIGCPLIIVGRTDSLSAKMIDTNIDPTDQPFILGIWDINKPDDLKTYAEAGVELLKRKYPADQKILQTRLNAWTDQVYDCSLPQAKKLANKLGIDLYFDWDSVRTFEGFYLLRGDNIDYVAQRMRQFVQHCDMIWIETDTPDLKVAKQLSDSIMCTHPDTLLSYNLSPSFNWDAFNMTDRQIREFSVELGKMGYVFQFITLAGFHMDALATEKFSRDFATDYVLAYVENVQRQERRHNVDQLKHQKWSGSEMADMLMTLGTIETSAYSSGKESTEHQFDNDDINPTK